MAALAALAGLAGGCAATGPLRESPLLLRFDRGGEHHSPLYVPQGPMAYGRVFETVEDVLSDYFVIAVSNRYDGYLETFPTIAPGIEQPWKPGSPDLYGRLLAFCQTIRHRAVVRITTADDGGFFLDVKVFRELEDLPAPTRATAGEATYRLESTVQRQNDVIDVDVTDVGWIPLGRDHKLEQVILDRLARMDLSCR
jgi:hypothetical protein